VMSARGLLAGELPSVMRLTYPPTGLLSPSSHVGDRR
jgi:hypothetical protein